jgi:hypothetical protein
VGAHSARIGSRSDHIFARILEDEVEVRRKWRGI